MAVATQRDASKAGQEGGAYADKTSFAVHFAGVVGELCFRKVYGGKLDLSVLRYGDDHRPDVLLPDGRLVEVKTVQFAGRNVELKLEKDEIGRSEFYSMVQVSLPDRGIVFPVWEWGWLKERMDWKSYGYGKRFVFSPFAAQ